MCMPVPMFEVDDIVRTKFTVFLRECTSDQVILLEPGAIGRVIHANPSGGIFRNCTIEFSMGYTASCEARWLEYASPLDRIVDAVNAEENSRQINE